jgi:glutamate synthase (NADPH/NADH) large chain
MSGGVAYAFDPAGKLPLRLNAQLVSAERAATHELYDLLERHVRHTGSPSAAALIADWPSASHAFWRVAPRAEVAVTSSQATAAAAPMPDG